MFYAWFVGTGLDVTVEESTSRGRLDMAVSLGDQVLIFEFTMASSGTSGSTMKQLRERGYAEKYRVPGRTVHLVAVELDRGARNLAGFEVERG